MHVRRFSLYEPVEFINTFLKDKLEWRQVRDNVAIHVPCTSKKLGVTSAFEQVAGLCAKEVTPSGIPCCGKLPVCRPLYCSACWPTRISDFAIECQVAGGHMRPWEIWVYNPSLLTQRT